MSALRVRLSGVLRGCAIASKYVLLVGRQYQMHRVATWGVATFLVVEYSSWANVVSGEWSDKPRVQKTVHLDISALVLERAVPV